MKKILRYLTGIVSVICLLSCDDNNSLHQKYIDQGETIYVGKVDSVKVFPGNNRVKCTWELKTDPRIVKTEIAWSDDAFVAVPVNRSTSGVLQMETVIDIPEGIYQLRFLNRNNEGDRSLAVEQTVEVYGERYVNALRNRTVLAIATSDSTECEVSWSIAENTAVYTSVRYVDFSVPDTPVEREIRVENNEMKTQLVGAEPNKSFSVTTFHKPENGIDIVSAAPREYIIN